MNIVINSTGILVISIGVKIEIFGKRYCLINDGKIRVNRDPITLAMKVSELGTGEILLNSINRDKMMQGYVINHVQVEVTSV